MYSGTKRILRNILGDYNSADVYGITVVPLPSPSPPYKCDSNFSIYVLPFDDAVRVFRNIPVIVRQLLRRSIGYTLHRRRVKRGWFNNEFRNFELDVSRSNFLLFVFVLLRNEIDGLNADAFLFYVRLLLLETSPDAFLRWFYTEIPIDVETKCGHGVKK